MPKVATSTRRGATPKPYAKAQTVSSTSRAKDPKQSHLYTDDNPKTTLHGTGFKDAETALKTISLVSQRSLTYQWQVINTMYHRAKGHPSIKKGNEAEGIRAAMSIFEDWLQDTYPNSKEERKKEGRDFKPLLKKETVRRYLDRIVNLEPDHVGNHGATSNEIEDCRRFAIMYAELPKGKRLANILLDDAHPEREDWEIRRERALMDLMMQRNGTDEDDLWNERGGASVWHLNCIGWAWSPVGEKRLPP